MCFSCSYFYPKIILLRLSGHWLSFDFKKKVATVQKFQIVGLHFSGSWWTLYLIAIKFCIKGVDMWNSLLQRYKWNQNKIRGIQLNPHLDTEQIKRHWQCSSKWKTFIKKEAREYKFLRQIWQKPRSSVSHDLTDKIKFCLSFSFSNAFSLLIVHLFPVYGIYM